MDLQIQENRAVVTSLSDGLGKASAVALAEEVANVVINGRVEEKLNDEIKEHATGSVIRHQGDITDEDDILALVNRTLENLSGIDHLVTSAGSPPSGAFMHLEDDDWDHAHQLLLMSVFRPIRESAEALRADGGGTIVNIASRSVRGAIPPITLSNSVQMGVIGLEKTLSREFVPEVRMNGVLLGPHETNRIRSLIEKSVVSGEYDSYEDGLADRSASVPVGQIGDLMGLGRTVAFLSSPHSELINGTPVTIDGGLGRATL